MDVSELTLAQLAATYNRMIIKAVKKTFNDSLPTKDEIKYLEHLHDELMFRLDNN